MLRRLAIIGTWATAGFGCLFFSAVFCRSLRECVYAFWDPDPIPAFVSAVFGLVASGGLAVPCGLVLKKKVGSVLKKTPGDHSDTEYRGDNPERDVFRFSPELFEYRNDVMRRLHENGFDWLTHYSAVDIMQDVYGIEVCGIRDEDDASDILRILADMFPSWATHKPYYKDYGRDPGFMVTIQRDPEPPDEQWQTAS
jgi:hypothetical protein